MENNYIIYKHKDKSNLLIISFLFFLIVNLYFCSGTRPKDLGLKESNTLKECPPSPNCVSSFSSPEDTVHYIAPLTYPSDSITAWKNLEKVIQNQERTAIIQKTNNYLYVEFTTKIMRFVDDVEFVLDEKNKCIHVRSASRLGYSDLGVNRKRVEKIRNEFTRLFE